MGTPVESVNSLYGMCVSAPQQVCEPADAFWKLAVPSKSQWWVGFAVQLGQLEGLVPLSASPHWLSTNLESLVCACKRRNISTTVHAVKKIFRTSRFPVQLNLTYMTQQRLLCPVFLVSVTSLHFSMFVCEV